MAVDTNVPQHVDVASPPRNRHEARDAAAGDRSGCRIRDRLATRT
ncbi:hypothetical protein ACFFHJ_28325 [Planotetraspora thailandica]|nr:hypothetical protein [Planotetraspora thailandica]